MGYRIASYLQGLYSKRVRVLGEINRIFLFRDQGLKYRLKWS